jgi:hypothetical protein
MKAAWNSLAAGLVPPIVVVGMDIGNLSVVRTTGIDVTAAHAFAHHAEQLREAGEPRAPEHQGIAGVWASSLTAARGFMYVVHDNVVDTVIGPPDYVEQVLNERRRDTQTLR